MIQQRLKLPLWFALWPLLFVTVGLSQDVASNQPVLDEKVARFELKSGTILDGLSLLSSQPIVLTMGFEQVLKTRSSDPPPPETHFSLRLENSTVREVLDALCRSDLRYQWSAEGTTVNVFPRAVAEDSTYFLNRRLDQLKLTDVNGVDEVLGPLARQLPPPKEQFAIAQVGGSTSYAKPWTTMLENLTVRQVMNRAAAHLGPRGGWFFGGSKDFRFFTFYSVGFSRPRSSDEDGQR